MLCTVENVHFQPRVGKSGHKALFSIFIYQNDHSFSSCCLFLCINEDEGEIEASPQPLVTCRVKPLLLIFFIVMTDLSFLSEGSSDVLSFSSVSVGS